MAKMREQETRYNAARDDADRLEKSFKKKMGQMLHLSLVLENS